MQKEELSPGGDCDLVSMLWKYTLSGCNVLEPTTPAYPRWGHTSLNSSYKNGALPLRHRTFVSLELVFLEIRKIN